MAILTKRGIWVEMILFYVDTETQELEAQELGRKWTEISTQTTVGRCLCTRGFNQTNIVERNFIKYQILKTTEPTEGHEVRKLRKHFWWALETNP